MRRLIPITLACTVAACAERAEGPFADQENAGLARYFGEFTPAVRDIQEDGTVTYQWDPAGGDGPVCMDGSPFHAMLRDLRPEGDTRNVAEAILFLQGGGACWDEVCVTPRRSLVRFPDIDLLDPFEPANPVAGWSSFVVPYCDGSFMMGDISIPEGADPYAPREQRGLRNLSAALDLFERELGEPERLLLVGASGGGYGALLGLPLVRMKFPNSRIYVLHDSGAGIARPGESDFIPGLVDKLGGQQSVLPSDCDGCFDEGHVTTLAGYQLERDDNLVIGDYSSWRDFLIADVFLQIGGDAYAQALDEQTSRLVEDYPGRYNRFIEAGITHTATAGSIQGVFGIIPEELEVAVGLIDFKTLRTAEIEGVDLGDWLGSMLAEDGWQSFTEIDPDAPDTDAN